MSEYRVTEHPVIRNVEMIYPNFEGRKGIYNDSGKRNFKIVLDDDTAKMLKDNGWTSVTYKQSKNDPDVGRWEMKVNVRFDKFPPRIVLTNSSGHRFLNEENAGLIDHLKFEKIDIRLSPYNYFDRRTNEPCCSAYLEAFYGTIFEDELDKEYGVGDPLLDNLGGCGNCVICSGNCHEND